MCVFHEMPVSKNFGERGQDTWNIRRREYLLTIWSSWTWENQFLFDSFHSTSEQSLLTYIYFYIALVEHSLS